MKENEKVEFKETWKDEYLRVIAAFANKNGGSLVVGIPKGKAKRPLEDLYFQTINVRRSLLDKERVPFSRKK
jgi:predicted HTH transcriptional regulator